MREYLKKKKKKCVLFFSLSLMEIIISPGLDTYVKDKSIAPDLQKKKKNTIVASPIVELIKLCAGITKYRFYWFMSGTTYV